MQLKDILKQLKKAKAKDTYTQAHLADASMKIEKALDAQFAIGSSSSGGGRFDFNSLFGE